MERITDIRLVSNSDDVGRGDLRFSPTVGLQALRGGPELGTAGVGAETVINAVILVGWLGIVRVASQRCEPICEYVVIIIVVWPTVHSLRGDAEKNGVLLFEHTSLVNISNADLKADDREAYHKDGRA